MVLKHCHVDREHKLAAFGIELLPAGINRPVKLDPPSHAPSSLRHGRGNRLAPRKTGALDQEIVAAPHKFSERIAHSQQTLPDPGAILVFIAAALSVGFVAADHEGNGNKRVAVEYHDQGEKLVTQA